MTKTLAAIVLAVLVFPRQAGADAEIHEWIGEYAMNHDGFQGTLRIRDSKRDCAAPAWCHLVASYVDREGAARPIQIRTIDQAGQHMVFFIAFPGNTQRFDAYLMSWDKNRMAGTTVWGGRTFGFFATRRLTASADLRDVARGRVGRGGRGAVALDPEPAGAESSGSKITINGKGEIETVMPDGTRRISRPGSCGGTLIFPDGKRSTTSCHQVPLATPPFPDQVSATWLDAHSQSLLDVIRRLLANDQASVDNYLRASESASMGVYDRIRMRTALISTLTSVE